MSNELISILVLVAIFVIGTTMPVNMGVLGIVAAFAVGTAMGVSEDDIFLGFPGDLFIILVGVTYLFAIATSNGTVNWLIHAAVRAVGGRVAAIPWVFFLVTAVLTASGAVVPGAVAIVAPIALGFALTYSINPVLMGLMVINGATAGGFSPISVFGSIVNGVVEREDAGRERDAAVRLLVRVQLRAQRRRLLHVRRARSCCAGAVEARRAGGPLRAAQGGGGRGDRAAADGRRLGGDRDAGEMPELDRDKILTLIGIATLIIVALAFDVDVGFVALSIASSCRCSSPQATKDAVSKVAWPTVLLICGIVTYVERCWRRSARSTGSASRSPTIGAPLFAALLICYVGGAVSAFASTTGILGALIPLAVPFLETGAVGAVGLIIALSISSSVVDSSPFSTSGALTVANTPEEKRDYVFKRLMQWGMSMVLIAPPIAWLIFVVPGWL